MTPKKIYRFFGNSIWNLVLPLSVLVVVAGCATPGLMKKWERAEQVPLESENFVVYLDDDIPETVGREVLSSLEFARERVGNALNYYSDEKVICNLYRNEQNLRNISVGLPLGFVVPRKAPLAYVLGGEVHGRIYSTPSGNISRLWVSTFPHEYCHVMFRELTGRQYYQYSWLQEGLGEYFRRLYLQERVLPPEFQLSPEENFLLTGGSRLGEPSSAIRLQDRTEGVWSYTDWEVRDAMRYEKLIPVKKLNPRTFVGYWQKFNRPNANQVYALCSSVVEYLVEEHGWGKMRQVLGRLNTEPDLDKVLMEVYGFDQDGLFENWKLYLKKRWPDPWQPNIAMVYLVRGNWEIDGHESGIRTAIASKDIESAQKHREYLHSRSIGALEPLLVLPVSHAGRTSTNLQNTDFEIPEDESSYYNFLPRNRKMKPPAIEHYEAAMAAYSMGRFAEGVEQLRLALEHEPEQIRCFRIHMARGLWLIGERTRALQLYREEILTSTDMPFLNEAAWCFERGGDKDTALRLYRTIVDSTRIEGLREHAQRRIDRIMKEPKRSSAPAVVESNS